MNLKLFEGSVCVVCHIKVAIISTLADAENETRLKSL